MKGQDKTPEKQLNKVEIGNLPENEFRIMIVKMIQNLREKLEAHIKNIKAMSSKEIEHLKNKQR